MADLSRDWKQEAINYGIPFEFSNYTGKEKEVLSLKGAKGLRFAEPDKENKFSRDIIIKEAMRRHIIGKDSDSNNYIKLAVRAHERNEASKIKSGVKIRQSDVYLLVLSQLKDAPNGLLMRDLILYVCKALVDNNIITQGDAEDKRGYAQVATMNIGTNRKRGIHQEFPCISATVDPDNKGRLIYHITEFGVKFFENNKSILNGLSEFKSYQSDVNAMFNRMEHEANIIRLTKSGPNENESEEVVEVEVDSPRFFDNPINWIKWKLSRFGRLLTTLSK